MKGYKATRNFKCLHQTYQVGKGYKSNKLKLCYRGIHFCQKMEDTLNYYEFNEEFILLEVETFGEVITDGNKSVTDGIRILRVVPPEEYTEEFRNFIPVLEYDLRGNRISETDSDGDKTTFKYDEKGNMISETYPSGNKYTYEYDDKGNRISVTDPIGDKWTYEYDEKGNKISQTDSDGYKTTYEYDERGNMLSKTDSDGYKDTFEYDYLTEID